MKAEVVTLSNVSFMQTENKSKRELIRMLVQKGYESDPVAAWTKAQEKVLPLFVTLQFRCFVAEQGGRQQLVGSSVR